MYYLNVCVSGHGLIDVFRYVKVHLSPLDASRACAFYCCAALEAQSQMSFNEGFRIPVPANALAVSALQLSVCSLGPQAQEELLVGLQAVQVLMRSVCGSSGVTCCVSPQGKAQVSLVDCERSTEMLYHSLQVQMLSGTELPRPEHKSVNLRRQHDGQEDEQRPRAMVNTQYNHRGVMYVGPKTRMKSQRIHFRKMHHYNILL